VHCREAPLSATTSYKSALISLTLLRTTCGTSKAVVADMVLVDMVVANIDFPCGRYGFLLWPISSCCGRYGLWPIWSHPWKLYIEWTRPTHNSVHIHLLPYVDTDWIKSILTEIDCLYGVNSLPRSISIWAAYCHYYIVFYITSRIMPRGIKLEVIYRTNHRNDSQRQQ